VSRRAGHADGLLSGATWGLVAVLLTAASDRLAGQPAVAAAFVLAAAHDGAAAVFLVGRFVVLGRWRDVVALVRSRRLAAVTACSVLGGPLFMGGYVAAVILAGPASALTVTATYPVLGAVLADRLLGQRLSRAGWLAVTATAAGAVLTAVDADASVTSVRALVGLGAAVVGTAALALEGIVADRAMTTADPDVVMVVREVVAALLFAVIVLAVPHCRSPLGRGSGAGDRRSASGWRRRAATTGCR
jgi:drug/metabolite transporter (DMT)-like permease